MDAKEADLDTPLEGVETPAGDDDNMKPHQQEPTFFSDERGNLKVVNLVVRNPCKIFWTIIALCILLTVALQALVFAEAEDGNPITTPGNEFDIDDVRSLQFDSLRLARDEVEKLREANSDGSEAVLKQSEVDDLVYWTFEAQTPAGVFGSAESIEAMKDAFDLLLDDDRFPEWCLLDYRTPLAENATRECDAPVGPLRMYYASEWDSEEVAVVMEQLKDSDKLATFNSLALCYIQGLFCELVPNTTSETDIVWVNQLSSNITSITKSWDMKGNLVDNITEATEFAAHLLQVDLFKGLIDFGYDKGFSVENQVSIFSRGFVALGGPLNSQGVNLTAAEKEALEENEDDLRKE